MEPWQRIGTYAAGLALDSAGVKGNAELLGRMDMIVAAGGGERDLAADSAILTGMPQGRRTGAFPQRTADERPAADAVSRAALEPARRQHLDRARRHRLLAHLHGRGGGRRRCGARRARAHPAGQSEIALVGGAYNGERREMLLHYEFARYISPARSSRCGRAASIGFVLGSIGRVSGAGEQRSRAGARREAGRAACGCRHARSQPQAGDVTATLGALWDKIAPRPAPAAVISGATGVEPATAEERAFLASHPDLAVRATGTHLGHGLEPQFAVNIALAAIAVEHGRLFATHDGDGFERATEGALTQVVVTSVGHWRGEGLALVEKID